MRRFCRFLNVILIGLIMSGRAIATENTPVNITEQIRSVVVDHQGTPVTIERVQSTQHRLVDDFSKTSRPCPPFCIQPMLPAPGVQTVAELELLEFLQTEVSDGRGLLIDARMSTWYDSETIPGAVNIPFTLLASASVQRDRIFELLGGVKNPDGGYDFSHALKLCLFCNGPWCDQSPRAVRALVDAGYPAAKLAHYRGGLQMWKQLGLTTVLPAVNAVKTP